MITFKRAYVATIDGKEQVFASLRDAQVAEIAALFTDGHGETWGAQELANHFVDNAPKFMAILTLDETSRPGARGKPKKRKSNGTAPELALKEGAAA